MGEQLGMKSEIQQIENKLVIQLRKMAKGCRAHKQVPDLPLYIAEVEGKRGKLLKIQN